MVESGELGWAWRHHAVLQAPPSPVRHFASLARLDLNLLRPFCPWMASSGSARGQNKEGLSGVAKWGGGSSGPSLAAVTRSLILSCLLCQGLLMLLINNHALWSALHKHLFPAGFFIYHYQPPKRHSLVVVFVLSVECQILQLTCD